MNIKPAPSTKARYLARKAGSFLRRKFDNLSIETGNLTIEILLMTSQQTIDRGDVFGHDTNVLVQSSQRSDFLVEIVGLGDAGTSIVFRYFLCVGQGFVVLGFQLMIRVCGVCEEEATFGDQDVVAFEDVVACIAQLGFLLGQGLMLVDGSLTQGLEMGVGL